MYKFCAEITSPQRGLAGLECLLVTMESTLPHCEDGSHITLCALSPSVLRRLDIPGPGQIPALISFINHSPTES